MVQQMTLNDMGMNLLVDAPPGSVHRARTEENPRARFMGSQQGSVMREKPIDADVNSKPLQVTFKENFSAGPA